MWPLWWHIWRWFDRRGPRFQSLQLLLTDSWDFPVTDFVFSYSRDQMFYFFVLFTTVISNPLSEDWSPAWLLATVKMVDSFETKKLSNTDWTHWGFASNSRVVECAFTSTSLPVLCKKSQTNRFLSRAFFFYFFFFFYTGVSMLQITKSACFRNLWKRGCGLGTTPCWMGITSPMKSNFMFLFLQSLIVLFIDEGAKVSRGKKRLSRGPLMTFSFFSLSFPAVKLNSGNLWNLIFFCSLEQSKKRMRNAKKIM